MANVPAIGQMAHSANPPNAPLVEATTRSPIQDSQPGPAASIVPMTSIPGLYGSSGRTIMLPPVIRSRSLRLSGIPATRTRTSPASGTGVVTTSRRNTSRGGPYSWTRQACMVDGCVVIPRVYEQHPSDTALVEGA